MKKLLVLFLSFISAVSLIGTFVLTYIYCKSLVVLFSLGVFTISTLLLGFTLSIDDVDCYNYSYGD